MVREMVAMRLELGDATPGELAEELRVAGTLKVVPPPPTSENGTEGDDEGFDNDHGEDVLGAQERPQPGVESSPSHNPYWTDDEVVED
jgi:hypothetical protein